MWNIIKIPSKHSLFIFYLQYHNQISILRLRGDFWHKACIVLGPPDVTDLSSDVMLQGMSTQEKVSFMNNTKITQFSSSKIWVPLKFPLFGSSGQSLIKGKIQQDVHQNEYWGSLKSLSHTNVPSLSRSVKPKTHEIS